ncbi:MAG: undecaprenyl-diphosphate phosphatase, partial [Anaerolineae bacterium]|nr:undecaprenyl-diphosphate phosphatase [Anaerolineae bacterium]
IQGATEFLPISSSGHLALVPWWFHWDIPDDLVFVVAVHMGTLIAVLIYFRKDWLAVLHGAVSILRTRTLNGPDSTLVWLLVVGTLPMIIGALLQEPLENLYQNPAAVAVFLLGTAGLLTLSELLSKNATVARKSVQDMGWQDALRIGFAQLIAILPGISRSGSTIAAGLALGIKREDAARFSFMLGTPTILAAGALTGIQGLDGFEGGIEWPVILAGFASAAVVGYGAIALLIAVVRRHRLYGFAIYCAFFGLITLVAVLLGR